MAATQTFDALSLVVSLRRQGVRLVAEGDELVLRGNPQALTREVLDELKSGKAQVLDLLEQERQAQDLPVLHPDPEHRHDPFPLNENQQAYWLGRDTSMAFGSVGIHVFFELDIPDFSRERFERAWNTLVCRHDMLRARVLPDGTQQVADKVPAFVLETTSLVHLSEEEAAERIDEAAQTLSHTCYDLEHWPQTTFRAFVLADRRTILMGSLDCWCLDGHSLQILMRELALLYEGHRLPPAPACSFRDYVLACANFRSSERYRASLAYWQKKVAGLPPAPVLPLRAPAGRAQSGTAPVFVRHETRLGAEAFARLSARLRRLDLTLSAFLLACYAETLGHWTYERRFTINVPRINRLPVHRDIENCVGEFASFSLTAMDLSDREATFLDRCRAVQRQVWQDLEHDHVSGVTVLRAWRQHTGAGPETGMPYVFTSEPESGGSGRESSWIGALASLGSVRRTLTQTPQVWIDAQYGKIRNELHLSWDVLDDLFAKDLPGNMFATYADLIGAMAESDAPWQERAPLHTLVQAHCTYSVEEGPARPVPTTDCLDLLARRARERGCLVAVTDSRGSMTWQEVHDATAALAAALHRAGLCAGARVALLLGKGRWQALASWAVRAAGGVLVPLDCEAPEARLRSLAHDCGASLVLTDTHLPVEGRLWDLPAFALDSETPLSFLNALPALAKASPLADGDLGAIVYTSGSTGTPKGVLVPFAGIVNAVLNIGAMRPLGQETPALALSPFHHDMAMPDYVGSLLLGMPLVYPDQDRRKDPEHWLALVQQHRVGYWNSVPAMMTMLMDVLADRPADLSSLRLVTLGGDWLPIATVAALRARAPQAAVFSIGGPTEISMANIAHEIGSIDPAWTSIPYGKPFANTGCQVCNEAGRPCPRGVAGELCCTGPFMALGYLHDEERTRTAFAVSEDGERLYHTGDMGRMDEDGVLEILGRRDNQVKMHGYRIELSEIENVLRSHDAIHEAVVLVATGEQGAKRLCAWVQPEKGCTLDEDEVRRFAAKILPAYMVPSLVALCPSFPLTANGKLDRRALEDWHITCAKEAYTPKTPTEALVCEAWKQVLGSSPASGQSNFFEAGGDSLSAIRLLNALRAACGCQLAVMDIFRQPAPALLAALLDERGQDRGKDRDTVSDLPAIEPTPRRKRHSPADSVLIVPATHAQTRLWTEEQTQPQALYTLSFRFSVTGRIRPEVLEAALNRVVARHEALRTSLHGTLSAGTGPSGDSFLVEQHIHAACPLQLHVLHAEDGATDGTGNGADRAKAFFEALEQQPLPLDRAPLLRAGLALLADEEAELGLVFHHAIFDGWSMQVFLNSLQETLGTDAEQRPESGSAESVSGPAHTADYGDLADWEQSASVRELAARRLHTLVQDLAKVRPPQLPDCSLLQAGEGTAQDGAWTTIFHEQVLAPDCAARMRELARRLGMTPFMVGLCAFALLVSRMSGEENLLLGTYAALRGRPELESVVGLLVNPVPLILKAGGARTAGELLALCRTAVMEAADNALVPFDLLVREVRPDREAGRHPIFDCGFSQDNTADSGISGAGMHLRPRPGGRHATALQLDVALREGSQPAFEATARAPQWTEQALAAFCQRLVHVLDQITRDPDRPLDAISICTPDEARLLDTWSTGTRLASPWPSLWERFADVAARTPDRICLSGARPCTFAELRILAERMAAAMAQIGTRSGTRGCLALYLERGPEFVAAMLAAWRCGRSVLPLSRLQPVSRLSALLRQAAVSLLVVQSRDEAEELCRDCPASPCVLALADLSREDSLPTAPLPAPASLPAPAFMADDDPALVLFTSGSSGVPKGVVTGHRTLVNRLQWAGEAVPYAADERALARADTSFIDAVTELFSPLLHGVEVSVLPDEEVRHMDRLAAFLEREGVTRLVSVPSALRVLAALAEHKGTPFFGIRTLVSSGEPLHGALLHKLREAFPRAQVFNFYGSTECAGEATWYATGAGDEDRVHVPLGRPIAGTTVCVRDRAGHVLPWGIPGEIVVRGQALALGYLAQDGSLAPLGAAAPGTLATGDLGAWSPDGQLIGLGRRDRQLKIRGQRLAPQEVEEILQSLPQVDEACVLALHGDEESGDKDSGDETILCACVSGRDVPDETSLRQALAGRLPQAFIPSLFLRLPAFPATASGKKDMETLKRLCRVRLSEARKEACNRPEQFPDQASEQAQGEATGRSPVAARAGRVWHRVLGRTPQACSHFFLDGGHSLLAVRLAMELGAELGLACEARDLFVHPVFADLVQFLEHRLQARVRPGEQAGEEAEAVWEDV